MPFFITDSETPLLLETVPALKITQYYGNALRDNVYAYLRCFVLHGALHCCFTCFDEAPPPSARMSVCLQTADVGATLICSVGKTSGVQLFTRAAYSTGLPLPQPQLLPLSPTALVETGGDEQGLYWSLRTEIPAEVFRNILGFAPESGTVLFGNLFLHSTTEPAFGAAFPVPAHEPALTQVGLVPFPIVPY